MKNIPSVPWPTVALVAAALAAIVGVFALLPADQRTDNVTTLLTLVAAATVGAGALPGIRRKDGER